jgi:hypothetical protein
MHLRVEIIFHLRWDFLRSYSFEKERGKNFPNIAKLFFCKYNFKDHPDSYILGCLDITILTSWNISRDNIFHDFHGKFAIWPLQLENASIRD